MSALAEALLAAQRQAVGTLTRMYGIHKGDEAAERIVLCGELDAIGCTDKIEQQQLLASLDVLRRYGVQPQSNGAARPAALDEPATKAQLDFIAKLSDDKGRVVNTDGMTKVQASQVIEALKRDDEITF